MQEKMDIFQILLQSGFVVQSVLLLLIFASILSWAIIIYKFKSFKKVSAQDEKFLNVFREQRTFSDLYENASLAPDSTLGIMFSKGYHELNKIKEKLGAAGLQAQYAQYIKDHGIHALERALKQGINQANSVLDQRLSILASIGSVSPFVGLFGTVWGIIDAFTGLASGGGTIEAVAPGIAEALVATAVGLAAAIPAVWAYNHYSYRVNQFNSEMESFGQEFINTVERSLMIAREA